jgi:hypothetical protein
VSGFLTTTSATPSIPAGVTAVIEVDELKTTPVAAIPPISTVAPFTKPVPVIVIDVPPAVPPLNGKTLDKVGSRCTATVQVWMVVPSEAVTVYVTGLVKF